jgi:hypothetical protein
VKSGGRRRRWSGGRGWRARGCGDSGKRGRSRSAEGSPAESGEQVLRGDETRRLAGLAAKKRALRLGSGPKGGAAGQVSKPGPLPAGIGLRHPAPFARHPQFWPHSPTGSPFWLPPPVPPGLGHAGPGPTRAI